MTSSKKALLRYGPLATGALFCALLAGLGCFRTFPALSGPVKKVCVIVVAAGMTIQGAALFPRKWESRLIVKPHALAAGSLMLLAGAALILALLVSGCSPATATPRVALPMNFTAANRAELEPYSALDGPSSLPAQLLSWKRTDEKQAACPRLRPEGKRFCVAVYARSKAAPALVRRSEQSIAVEQATIRKVQNEQDV